MPRFRKTKVRIVGEPELTKDIEKWILQRYKAKCKSFDKTPYRYAKSQGITIYMDVQ